MRRYILLFFLCLGILATGYAQSKSEKLKSNKKKIEAEIASTQKLLNQTSKNKQASLQQLSVLRRQISNREELITSLNNEIFSMEEELDLNIKLYKELDKKLEYMKTDYSRIVYLAYKNRNMIDKVAFLLASEDFSQMFRRIKYYTIFANDVKRQGVLIKQTQEEIAKKNEEILQLKEEKTALLEGKEKEIRQLEIDRNNKTKATEALKKQEKQLASELKSKQQKRRELDAAIKKAIQEEILAANKKKAAANKKSSSSSTAGKTTTSKTEITLTPEEKLISDSFVSNKGKLPWPVLKGAKISEFGNYPHPDVPSVMIENKGIDILVEPNTPVRAVFQGEVAGVLDIMGTKVLMIRHGEYLSVYQNITNVNVKKGDKVSTKQTVGTVSKSTRSKTYELHFDVWKNSTNLNPSSWLSAR